MRPFGAAAVALLNRLSRDAIELRLDLADARQLGLQLVHQAGHPLGQFGGVIGLGAKAGNEFGRLRRQRGNFTRVIRPGWSGWSGWSDVPSLPARPASPAWTTGRLSG